MIHLLSSAFLSSWQPFFVGSLILIRPETCLHCRVGRSSQQNSKVSKSQLSELKGLMQWGWMFSLTSCESCQESHRHRVIDTSAVTGASQLGQTPRQKGGDKKIQEVKQVCHFRNSTLLVPKCSNDENHKERGIETLEFNWGLLEVYIYGHYHIWISGRSMESTLGDICRVTLWK